MVGALDHFAECRPLSKETGPFSRSMNRGCDPARIGVEADVLGVGCCTAAWISLCDN